MHGRSANERDGELLVAVISRSTRSATMKIARSVLGSRARIVSGTNAYFTELNRERPPVPDSNLVTYSINPQVHAFDPLSLIENPPSGLTKLRYTITRTSSEASAGRSASGPMHLAASARIAATSPGSMEAPLASAAWSTSSITRPKP